MTLVSIIAERKRRYFFTKCCRSLIKIFLSVTFSDDSFLSATPIPLTASTKPLWLLVHLYMTPKTIWFNTTILCVLYLLKMKSSWKLQWIFQVYRQKTLCYKKMKPILWKNGDMLFPCKRILPLQTPPTFSRRNHAHRRTFIIPRIAEVPLERPIIMQIFLYLQWECVTQRSPRASVRF